MLTQPDSWPCSSLRYVSIWDDPLFSCDDSKAKKVEALPWCLCVCFSSLSHPAVLSSCSLKGLRINMFWMAGCILFLSGTLKVRVKQHLRSLQDALLITTSCWHEEGGRWAYQGYKEKAFGFI